MSTASRPSIEVHEEDRQVWRIGHRPEPWEWVPWKYSDKGRFSGRWDDPGGEFRTIYAGHSLLSCLLEVLAHFRPDPTLVDELGDIEVNDAAGELTPRPGAIPRAWLDRRCAATARMNGRFCAVTQASTISALRPKFLKDARSFSLEDFDAAALRDPRPRGLTQQVAAHLWRITDLDGIQYASRHGDDHKLWAIFERPDGDSSAPCLTDRLTVSLSHDSPDLVSAFEIHRLCWEDVMDSPALPLPLVEMEAAEEAAKVRELFGDSGPTMQTPLGTAVLFQLALADPVHNKVALERLVYNPENWRDFAEAQFITSLGYAEHVMESTDDPSIRHVKFLPLAGSRSAVAFTATEIPDAVILTLVNPGGGHNEWKVRGLSEAFVPTGPQVRGEKPFGRNPV